MWKNLYHTGAKGSEYGEIIADEEYMDTCRLTLEKCSNCYAITCGVYGGMVHTVFCDADSCRELYNNMKNDLQIFFDGEPSYKQELEFYEQFTARY